eukprot:CAMPEP_0117445066 /NCGR_PEP_ID=MMETSP0759-20121206/5587_1 /TAXON_ID=63605 /ORGANISM="Percolomonas cosmopolitus, Strain WS" /LENGTH=1090 /DNA_ID=CAMNT_0005237197 /DNA_START=260 /DNA_END=3532 /DNA_ORIENTATION=-
MKGYLHVLEMSSIHYKAHFKLASLYEKGCSLDYPQPTPEQLTVLLTKAVYHYEKAADLGYQNAQFNLGILLMKGSGTTKNEDAAVKWLRRAAENGSKRASVVLEKILTEQRAKRKILQRQINSDQALPPSNPSNTTDNQSESEQTDEQLFDRLKALRMTNPLAQSSFISTARDQHSQRRQNSTPRIVSPSHDDTNSLEEDEQTYNTAVDHQPHRHLAEYTPLSSSDDERDSLHELPLPDLPTIVQHQQSASHQMHPQNGRQPPTPESNDTDSHDSHDVDRGIDLLGDHNSEIYLHDSNEDRNEEDDRELDELDSLSSTDIVNRLLGEGPGTPGSQPIAPKSPARSDSPQPKSLIRTNTMSPLEKERRKVSDSSLRILVEVNEDDDDDDGHISETDDVGVFTDTHRELSESDTLSLQEGLSETDPDASHMLPELPRTNEAILQEPLQKLHSREAETQRTHRRHSPLQRSTSASPLTINTSASETVEEQNDSASNSPRPSSPRTPRAIRRRGFGPEELAEIEELENKLNDAKKEVKEKRTAVKLLGAEKKREEQRFKRKEARIVKLDTKMKSLELKLLEREQEQEQTQEEHKKHIKKLKEHYEMELQEREEMIASLASENDVVQSTVEKHFHSMRETHGQQLEEKMAVIREHEATIHRLQNNVRGFQQELKDAEEEFSRRMEATQEKFEKNLKEREDYLQDEIHDLSKQLEDSKRFHQNEIGALKEEMDRTTTEHAARVLELKQRIEEMRDEARASKQEHHEEVLRRESALKSGFQEEKRELIQRIQNAEQNVDEQVRQKIEGIQNKHKQQYSDLAEEHEEHMATLKMDHKQTLQKTETMLRKLQQENAQLKNNDALSKKVSEQEQHIAQLRTDEKEAQRVISNISRQNFSFIETIELNAQNEMKFVEKINLQEKKIRLLESKSRQLEAHVEHLKAENSSMPSREEVDRVKHQSEKLQQIMIQQFDKIQEYKDRIEDLEEQLQEYETQMQEMSTQLSHHERMGQSRKNGFGGHSSSDTLSTLMDDNDGRSEAFEKEYARMMEVLGSGGSGASHQTWDTIREKLKFLKQEYLSNVQRHREQIHDVISFMQSIR